MLQTIREDFEGFLENGAWKFLVEEDDESNGEGRESGEVESDESFSVDDEEGEDEESDFEESDEDDEDDEEYESSEEDELSEEGLSWDEMERQAEEEDRRAATRRVGKEAVPVPQKRGAAPPRGGRR